MISVISTNSCISAVNSRPLNENQTTNEKTKIQVALLLDTSSSMDGLIDQAKACLWNIVNTLTTLKFGGTVPDIEIALYEYGNNGIHTKENDYIRQVIPLTSDLDLISEKLFALRTNGGSEYCGAVIEKSVKQLEWGKDKSDMKLIYIAGNEPFTQGNVNYKSAIKEALADNIYVNTIHCGYAEEGIRGMWQDGAVTGKGKYFNIDHNRKIIYVETPYDKEIMKCNERLNSTYIGYGENGIMRAENQIIQDKNAESVSSGNYTERAVSKSKAVYDNSSWDLVDMYKKDQSVVSTIDNKKLPSEYQNKSKEEIQKIVEQKETERKAIQKEISELSVKRQQYIDSHSKEEKDDDLGKAVKESIFELAQIMGYDTE